MILYEYGLSINDGKVPFYLPKNNSKAAIKNAELKMLEQIKKDAKTAIQQQNSQEAIEAEMHKQQALAETTIQIETSKMQLEIKKMLSVLISKVSGD